MKSSIKAKRILTPDGIVEGYVNSNDGIIESVSTAPLYEVSAEYADGYLMPGFVELHTHGAGGYPFLTEDAEVVARACGYHLAHGTTTILPTLSASPIEVMEKGVKAIKEARDKGLCRANIVGAHLEGPYLSEKQCGAQCTDYITPPSEADYTALVEKYGDAIARWSYAPERDEGGKFAKHLTSKGILPSAGHTDATYDDMKLAEESGCRLVTHLYSCTSTITRKFGFRSLGVIESTYLSDTMYAELIADGKHLPKELVRMIVKIMGTDRVALITDSLEIAGTDIKEGVMAGTAFIVEDGVCKLRDRSAFAGSVATSDVLLRFAVNDCGFTVEEASHMMSDVPARLIGINAGRIESGRRCDLVHLTDSLEVSAVYVLGEKI